ncbi:MAG TPA: QsdR family transcriptional regulator [Nocardioides sp.]
MSSANAALARARETFARGERVEMGPLADSLEVNRVTLYRWIGNREDLLAELLWERMKRGLDRLDARVRRAGSTGPDRLTQVILGFFAAAGHGSPERAFVDREPALAMRVMTAGPVHDRLIAWFTAAIEQEANAGTVVPLHPPAQIADIVVRSGEAVFWFDRASGRGIDRDNLVVILSALCPATTPK